MATLYRCDGEIIEVHPRRGNTFSLKELQTYVGGDIEIITFNGSLWVCNKEGKFRKLPMNVAATHFSYIDDSGDYFVGDVLQCSSDEIE